MNRVPPPARWPWGFRQLALGVTLAGALLGGCTGPSALDQLEAGRQALANGKRKEAIILLKSSLQANPDLADARFLLGQALLARGEGPAALIELRKAQQLAHPDDELVPELAQAMLSSGQANKLLAEWSQTTLSTPAADARLRVTLARASLAVGRRNEARAHLARALEHDRGFSPALLVQTELLVVEGRTAEALVLLEQVLGHEAGNAQAWKLKGDLLRTLELQPAQAAEAYRAALAADPGFDDARTGLVQALLEAGQLGDAESELGLLLERSPANAMGRYLEALLAFDRKDFKRTRELTQAILKAYPDAARAMLLGAAAEAELGRLLQAQALLGKAVLKEPGLLPAHHLLVAVHLRAGNHEQALKLLNDVIERGGMTPAMLSLAGQVYLANGDAERAQVYLEKALRADPEDAPKRTALALSRLASGQTQRGFDELRRIADTSRTTEADLALVSEHLKRGEFEQALATLDKMEGKPHERAMAATLRGRVLLGMGRRDQARGAFDAALAAAPDYQAAAAALAAMDVADGQPAAARRRFQAMIDRDAGNAQAMLALAALSRQLDEPAEAATALYRQAIQASPEDPGARVLLVMHHLRAQQRDQALAVAQAAHAAMPEHYGVLEVLGRVQQINGAPLQALASYAKLIPLRPQSPEPYLRLAEAHVANGDPAEAAAQLRKGLTVQEDALALQQGLYRLLMEQRDWKGAAEVAATVQRQRPRLAAGHLMAAETAAARGDGPGQVAALRQGAQSLKTAEFAVKLHETLLQQGQRREAEVFASQWRRELPGQVTFILHLGDVALRDGRGAQASSLYREALKLEPDHPLAHNNLAYSLSRADPGSAVAHARRATELKPGLGAFWDTLSVAELAAGHPERAVQASRQAVELEPGSPGHRLTLARALLALGMKDEARKLLAALAAMGSAFPDQNEVARLQRVAGA